MRAGKATESISEAERALVKYVRKVAANPKSIEAADIEVLRKHGWSNAEIVEALAMACLGGFTNTLAQAMRFEDDLVPMGFDGYF